MNEIGSSVIFLDGEPALSEENGRGRKRGLFRAAPEGLAFRSLSNTFAQMINQLPYTRQNHRALSSI